MPLYKHAILGEPYLERPMLSPSTGEIRRVFLLDFEMPRAALMSRWVALAGEYEWEDRPALFDNERVSLQCYRPLMTSSRDWIAYICGQVVACCNPGDVMLIDCLQLAPLEKRGGLESEGRHGSGSCRAEWFLKDTDCVSPAGEELYGVAHHRGSASP